MKETRLYLNVLHPGLYGGVEQRITKYLVKAISSDETILTIQTLSHLSTSCICFLDQIPISTTLEKKKCTLDLKSHVREYHIRMIQI